MYKYCCFIGHRKIEITDKLVARVEQLIENLIVKENVAFFVFGSNSQFDGLCIQVVDDLKEKYPHLKKLRFTCKSETCFLENDRAKKEAAEKFLTQFYKKEVHMDCFDEEIEFGGKNLAGRQAMLSEIGQ